MAQIVPTYIMGVYGGNIVGWDLRAGDAINSKSEPFNLLYYGISEH